MPLLRRQLLTGLLMTAVLVVVLGVAYPLVVWAIAKAAFPHQADGSLVRRNGRVVGSALIGQSFTDAAGNPLPQYFQPRPSAAGKGYDAGASGASNVGPSSQQLLDSLAQRVAAYRRDNGLSPGTPVPGDAVTASGSGLDPDISLANALDQAARVAAARHLSLESVTALIRAHTAHRPWGFLGEESVDVLDLNLALDGVRSGHN